MIRRLFLLFGLIALASAFACSSPADRDLGASCEADDECAGGLTCKQNFVANQCTAQKTCTKTCTTEADCEAIDAKGKCFQGCNNEQICMLTP